MRFLHFSIRLLLAATLLALAIVDRAQTEQNSPSLLDAGIVKLAPIQYPPLARQVRIAGDVELRIEVNSEGMAASADAVSGHPLLVQSALDNAKRSRFACDDCAAKIRPYRLIYTFQLNSENKASSDGAGEVQDPEHPGLTVSHYLGHVVVTDWPLIISDPGPDPLKVRSLKCLYLWKCKRR